MPCEPLLPAFIMAFPAAPPIEAVSFLQTVFELLFLALAFISVFAALAALAMLASRRRRAGGRTTLIILGFTWAAYFSVVAVTAASTRPRVVKMNQDLCFDEMCFAAVHVKVQPRLGPASQPVSARGKFYIVTIRVSNHARGYRTEREPGIRARLWRGGTYYDVSSAGQQAYESAYGSTPKLTDTVGSGQSILSVQVFDLPSDARTSALVLDHGFTPGYFVIGESPVFHKPTVFSLGPS